MSARSRDTTRVKLNVKAELAWMDGAPCGQGWQVVPALGAASTSVTLSRDHLRRAALAIKTLLRERPRLLERIGGDAQRWHDTSLAQLEALKVRVHDRKPLADPVLLCERWSGKRTARLARDVRRVCPGAVAPLVWRLAREPEVLDRALRWAIAESASLLEMARAVEEPQLLILRLAQLAEAHGRDSVAPICRVLGNPAFFTTPLEGDRLASRMVTQMAKGTAAPPLTRPVAASGTILATTVLAIAASPAAVRRHALELLSLVVPTDDVRRWERWWEKRDALYARATALMSHVPHGKKRNRDLARIAQVLGQHEAHMPAQWSAAQVLSMVSGVANGPEPAARAIAAALAAFPRAHEGRPARIPMLQLWSMRLPDHARAVAADATAVAAFLAAHEREQVLPHWRRYWQSVSYHECIDQHLMYDSAKRISAYYATLSAWCRATSAPADIVHATLQHLIHDASRALPADRAAAVVIATRAHEAFGPERWVLSAVLEAALQLAGGDDSRVVALMAVLVGALPGDETLEPSDPIGLREASTDARVAALLGDAALRDVRRVLRLGRRKFALRKLGGVEVPCPRPGEGDSAAWMRRYPSTLLEKLCVLSSLDERAEDSAAAALGRDSPDPGAIRQEMAAIAARIGTARDAPARARLEKRLHNLGRRLRAPTPSARKLAAMVAKLDVLIERRTLETWEERVEHNLGALVAGRLSLGRAPSWLIETPAIELLPHLLCLPRPHRRLAERLLRARAGPYPWDLRDEPQNRAFLDRLEARGIDVRPWLEGIGVMTRDTTKGRAFAQLERDPLEVLRMGEHFETCLTPGNVNFFSAVGNAADVNKRVLYAHDAHGAVIGRCLLALTAAGHVLTFHAYHHDQTWCFGEMARDFVLALAERMGTEVVSSGRVEMLLCADWYDDGPVDLTGRFDRLYSDELRQRLDKLPPPEAIGELERAVAPLGLGPVTLPLVLGLHAVTRRDELVAALAPAVAAESELPLHTRALVAVCAHRAGAVEVARQLALEQIAPRLERSRQPVVTNDMLELLVKLGQPSLVLRVLRRTRGDGVRRWADEWDGGRIRAAARAHAALHRRRLAATLCERLARLDANQAAQLREELGVS